VSIMGKKRSGEEKVPAPLRLRQPQDDVAIGLARAADGAQAVHEPRLQRYSGLRLGPKST
jgi:hypothetical protein